MMPTGFPVHFPTAPSVLPPVRMAQPGQSEQQSPGWSPARRAQPMMAQQLNRPVRSSLAGPQVGQTTAELVARGSDITFSILTGLAAAVSGVGLIFAFGKGEEAARRPALTPARPGERPVVAPPTSGKTSKPHWYWIGGAVALLGVANIWASINRAAALQVPAPQTTTTASS